MLFLVDRLDRGEACGGRTYVPARFDVVDELHQPRARILALKSELSCAGGSLRAQPRRHLHRFSLPDGSAPAER